MSRTDPDRPSFTAFFKVVAKAPKSRNLSNRNALKQLSIPEVREQLSIEGIAVLSDN
ncbi:hypothetical protein QWZ13_12720 [Reinekea marina]|uniref:Uncharacterized protein n=1 Tax=Reinekea marina TaxID=1310421 RepID=A0ABV7WXC5_9GAMM|nr:hypothetical protein [Reinekea marina]MBU2862230.1 hypothetical protein [Reinekea forsetii]MDN3649776.1 hypothetical protein [Reinekea marina]